MDNPLSSQQQFIAPVDENTPKRSTFFRLPIIIIAAVLLLGLSFITLFLFSQKNGIPSSVPPGMPSSTSPSRSQLVSSQAGSLTNSSITPQSEITNGKQTSSEETRSFFMGFTPWPPDFTEEGVNQAYSFIKNNSDIIAHHLDGGVPWPEALANKDYSQHLQNDWKFRKSNTPSTHKIFLSITPLNFARDNLAPYWGTADNLPLPPPWDTYRLNSTPVKQAYLQYAKKAIAYFNPTFLAIGIESNILLSKDIQKWNDYKELNDYIYTELKKSYPTIIIFPTIQYEHLRGIENEAKKNANLQIPEVKDLLLSSDILAISTYHYGIDHNQVSSNYFDLALSFNKPVVISEMGAIAKDVTINNYTIKASEEDQKKFIQFILEQAKEKQFQMVINYITIDYDKALPKLPSTMAEVAKAWVYTGLQTSDGQKKPAYHVWNQYKKLQKR